MSEFIVRYLGVRDYKDTLDKMHQFTASRTGETPDEIWLLEHEPVFTQGQNGEEEHILTRSDIPVVQSDRGGEVTYHAPGQLIAYLLIDIHRKKLSIKKLVNALEQSVVTCLEKYGIASYADPDAPGVYTDGKKICSLGLRVKRGCTLHGLALNINMDLSPFGLINPCGYAGLQMTQTSNLGGPSTIDEMAPLLSRELTRRFKTSLLRK